jgi:hypothetical protein
MLWVESIDAGVCVEAGKCDRQGRRIRGADEWLLILKRYDQGALTQAAPLKALRRGGSVGNNRSQERTDQLRAS